MAKEKVTITLDRAKADAARNLVGAQSTSETIDIALDRLVRVERLDRDIEAYRRTPPTTEERALAARSWAAPPPPLGDETDWAALYAPAE